jgi:hypothetical protein
MNEKAVLACRRPGEGLFITGLDRELKRCRLTVPAFEHDLAAELRGQRQAVLATGTPRTLGANRPPPGRRRRVAVWLSAQDKAWGR